MLEFSQNSPFYYTDFLINFESNTSKGANFLGIHLDESK